MKVQAPPAITKGTLHRFREERGTLRLLAGAMRRVSGEPVKYGSASNRATFCSCSESYPGESKSGISLPFGSRRFLPF
jgi:hypothetical protein